MYGAGVNLQRCHRMIFAGVGFKFQDFIQSIHRIHRFGQTQPCVIDVIYSETETEVLRTLQAKWQQHEQLMTRMGEIIREYGLNHDAAAESLKRTIGCERRHARAEDDSWSMVRNDCVDEVRRLADDSVDLVVTSIPFGNHYEYSESYNDFGHTDDHNHFFEQMDFLTPQLLRILKPGRVAAIHVKDRIQFASVTGLTRPTVEPFHADTIAHFRRHGFGYMGLRFIATDVVRENNATYRLTYKELRKDSTKMGSGSPEFLLLFFKLPTDRSNGYADEPVTKDADAYSLGPLADRRRRACGGRAATGRSPRPNWRLMTPDALAKFFPPGRSRTFTTTKRMSPIGEALAARKALPKTFSVLKPGTVRDDVWTDIARMRTLNGEQSRRGLENHICPLQFDIVDRAIRLYSNPGDLVLDPFAGLGTVPMRAVALGRRGTAIELNEDYWRQAVRYCGEAASERAVPGLFDFSTRRPHERARRNPGVDQRHGNRGHSPGRADRSSPDQRRADPLPLRRRRSRTPERLGDRLSRRATGRRIRQLSARHRSQVEERRRLTRRSVMTSARSSSANGRRPRKSAHRA
jgi:DNA modification methylase